MTDSLDLVKMAYNIIWFQRGREAVSWDLGRNPYGEPEDDLDEPTVGSDQLEELFRQFSLAVTAVVQRGVNASFDQKLEAMLVHDKLYELRYLLDQACSYHGNPLVRHLDPAKMVGDGFEGVWQALIDSDTGDSLRYVVKRLFQLPEVKLLERFDPHHRESFWQGADLSRLWDEEHDIYE